MTKDEDPGMIHRRSICIALLDALALVPRIAGAAETLPDVQVEAVIPRYGNYMSVGFGSVWLISGGNALVRINLSDLAVTDIAIQAPHGQFPGLAVGEDAVFLPDLDRSVIYRIDPKTNEVVKEIAAHLAGSEGQTTMSRAESSIGVDQGSIWVVAHDEVKRYSFDGSADETAIPLPSPGADILVAFGSVWVAGPRNDELYRVDPIDKKLIATIDVNSGPRVLAAEAGSVWVWNEGDGSVQRLDGKSGAIVATIETGARGKGSITGGGGFVWVFTRTVPLIQIDPRTNSVRGKFTVESHGYSTVRYGNGSLWISGTELLKIRSPA
jgi:virginiamycin B lyase